MTNYQAGAYISPVDGSYEEINCDCRSRNGDYAFCESIQYNRDVFVLEKIGFAFVCPLDIIFLAGIVGLALLFNFIKNLIRINMQQGKHLNWNVAFEPQGECSWMH